MIGRTVALVMVTTLAACGGGGGGDAVSASNVAPTTSASGPGDSEKYAPAGLGDRWTYDVLDNAAASQIENLVVSNQAVGSVTTFALRESSTDPNQPTQDATFFSDPGGLTQVSFSPPDPLQQQVGAYRSLLFPVQPGSFTAFDKPALDFGQDVDGDGKNERRSLKLSVEMAGFEPVDVAAGHFARAAKYIYTATDRVTTTATNRSFTATVASTEWRVPGVGLVKTSSVSSGDGIATTSASQQLRGYRVAGVQRGIGTPLDTLAQGSITSVNSSLFRAPSVAASASGFLVVAFRQASNTTGNWVGRFLDKAGVLQSTVDLSSVMDDGVENPAIASDGSNYLVLAQRSRIGQSPELVAWRVSPQGTLLDGPAGLAIGSGVPSQASVLFDGNRYLVVFSKQGAGDPSPQIFGSFVSINGVVGNEFRITSANGYHEWPSLAFDGTNFLLAWQMSDPAINIMAMRLNRNGTSLDGEGFIVCGAAGAQLKPKLAFDGTNYLVAWIDQRAAKPALFNNQGDVYAAWVSQTGVVRDAASDGFALHAEARTVDSNVALTFTGDAFLVTWGAIENLSLSGGKVLATTVPASGPVQDGVPRAQWELSLQPPRTPSLNYGWPALATSGDHALAVWLGNEYIDTRPASMQIIQSVTVTR